MDPHNHSAHNHSHENSEQPNARVNIRPLVTALAITATFLVVEVIGGLLTNSLALLADAGHMATDVAALSLALFAIWLAKRPPSDARSFGFYRAEILAALVNAATLVAVSIYIFWEAFNRIGDPPEINSGPMLIVAVAGLLANAASAWVLMRGGGHQQNLNTRGAFLHVIGDMLGSVGAIAAALIMLATGWYLADPILSGAIGLLVLWSSWRLLRESVDVLLESTPKGMDTSQIRTDMTAIEGVQGVHDLHVWTVTSGLVAMSAHVEVTSQRPWHDILIESTDLLRQRFGIAHITLQPEDPAESDLHRGCSFDSPEGLSACRVAVGGQPALSNLHRGHSH